MRRYAQVVVDSSQRWADGLYTYELPEELWDTAMPGCAVLVPFGKREFTGYLVDCDAEPPPETEIKPVLQLLQQQPVWPDELRRLALWLSDMSTCTLAEAFQTVVPSPILKRLLKPVRKRARKVRQHGLAGGEYGRHALNPEQTEAVQRILSGGTTLLEGVTGSGKTEVYLHAIEHVLQQGRGAIVLVPEVSLTPQAIDRYRGRLGDQVALLHSQLGEAERAEQWSLLYRGEARVALGTRSAIFAPVTDLGLIIVDEEHDGSYKQDNSPRYHARQVAAWRCEQRAGSCVLVLGSATPCVESARLAQTGRYGHSLLRRRASGLTLPEVQLVDLRRFRMGPREDLAVPLVQALETVLERGEQAVLLYNRRGFSRYLQCRTCGQAVQCPNCSICLTVHQHPRRLLCHYCAHARALPDLCTHCGAPELQARGSGTERLEVEIGERLPQARLLRMDRDTTARPGAHADILRAFGAGEADILLGTQMVAKGLDFPRVTLVGVVGADHGLHLPDFRASERTLQLLIQVAGRAGRAERPGRVLLQAWDADHPVFRHALQHDYAGFLQEELPLRQSLLYPPFCRLARLVVTAEEEKPLRDSLRALQGWFARETRGKAIRVLGPAPCPIERIKGLERWHFLFKANKVKDLSEILRNAQRQCKRSSSVRWSVDIDPQSLL